MDDRDQRRPATIRRGDAVAPETDWSNDDQFGDVEGPSGGILNNRFAKVGCGCALPILFLLSALGTLGAASNYGASPAEAIGELTGVVIGGIALVWVPLFLFWMRDKSKWLIGGSFVAVVAVFALLGLAKVGDGYSATNKDLSAVGSITFDNQGNPILPKGMATKGPMAKLMVELVAEQEALRGAFDADIAKLGADAMMDAGKVARNPDLVQNCRRFTDFKTVINGHRARNIGFAKAIPDKMDKLDVPASARAEIIKGAMAKQEANLSSINRLWDIQLKSIAPLHRSCLILSKRNWKAQGAVFSFFNPADMKAFNGAMAELKTLDEEIAAINAQRIDSAKAGQDKLKSLVAP
jgi:hypothetical protein